MDATSPSDEATGLDEVPVDDIENAVRLWDIVWWVDDQLTGRRHGKPKIWVCVGRDSGAGLSFFRVNSRQYDSLCILLSKDRYSFLKWDSYLGCGGELVEVEPHRVVSHSRNPTSLNRSSLLLNERELTLGSIEKNDKITDIQRKSLLKGLQGL